MALPPQKPHLFHDPEQNGGPTPKAGYDRDRCAILVYMRRLAVK